MAVTKIDHIELIVNRFEEYVALFRALGPAHTGAGDVATKGQGKFSHSGVGFYFSSSDNSDPNTNGHNYWAVRPG